MTKRDELLGSVVVTTDYLAQWGYVISDKWAAALDEMIFAGKFNPHHEPAGSPIGGQFADAPGGDNIIPYLGDDDTELNIFVREGPTDWLIKNQLKEVPRNHLNGLAGVDFVEGQLIPYKDIGAYGTYDPEGKVIKLSSNADNVGVIGGGTVIHEVGHHVHMSKLTDEGATEWARISNNGQSASISAYARTNRGEHFAEAYRAYTRGEGYRKKLKALEP